MPTATIDRLIVNSPYQRPAHHWRYDPDTQLFDLVEGRRPAGYVVATPGAHDWNDPGHFVPIPLVNAIRDRVDVWREAGYPGVTGVTRRLLEHWNRGEEHESRQFFFCQLEAIETLIWLAEAPPSEHTGLEIAGDGSAYRRLCCKMATGSGKTVVMAMLIAWQILNKLTYPQDPRYARNVLVLAPGLTVRSRLSVLDPNAEDSYYREFPVVPSGDLMERLRQGRVIVRNWQSLAWESEEQVARRRSVDKRGPLSDEAWTRKVLGDMHRARNLLVINDEAHHAWRMNPEARNKYLRRRDMRDSATEATVWVGGLDRLHDTRGILAAYDFSATPFAPSGNRSTEETLFGWIVSDFGLNDSIESGLVKTPRVVIRDDALASASTYRSRLYHIYNDPDVRDDLNRRAAPEEPLPDLVRNAYYLLGFDWRDWHRRWEQDGAPTPPVMITVANRTETAARVAYTFQTDQIAIEELCDPDTILHIDSKVLSEAEAQEEPVDTPVSTTGEGEDDEGDTDDQDQDDDASEGTRQTLTKKQRAELLRRMVDTVGRPGEPGAPVRNVISVGMLSEGWDARTVTHIMGLRAFTSQLLCEQVVGRGLRRTSYDVNPDTGLYEPEYVNVFGVPFSFLPHEGGHDPTERKIATRLPVFADPERSEYEITWPNLLRVDSVLQPRLTVDWSQVAPLELDASQTAQVAELAPVLDGRPDVTHISEIALERLAQEFRTQRIVFAAARSVYAGMVQTWTGDNDLLLAQLIRLVEQFMASDLVRISPPLFYADPLRRRLILTLNMTALVQHVLSAVQSSSTDRLVPVFDRERPVGSTGQMGIWYTGRPTLATSRSHINRAVLDSTWEGSDAWALDHHPRVAAWAKNDHLGFQVYYTYRGAVRAFRPDFLVRLQDGEMMVLETKGQDDTEQRAKREALDRWIVAVNEHGAFGHWSSAVLLRPGAILDVLGVVE